jgi:hypothetical protein
MHLSLPCAFSYYGKKGTSGVESDIHNTYLSGSGQLRARFLSRLTILSKLPRAEWHEGYMKQLSGNCSGLSEIRFLADRVQQRPLGFQLNDREFVLLLWAREKGDKFVPKKACEIALKRKAEILQDGNLKHDLWLALE